MFVPISDDNRLRHLPYQYVTVGLIAVNVLVYVFFTSGIFVDGLEPVAYSFGVIPAVFNDFRELPSQYAVVPEGMTLVTYQFVHGGFLHLVSNMLFLWVFGDNVEDAMGHWRFLAFYLLCGAGAGLAHDLVQPRSVAPLVGASGAVSGVIAAYLMLHPKVKVWVLVLWRLPLRLPASWVLGFWVVLQVVMVASTGSDEEVAWWAHIGGLVTGAVLVLFMRRRGVPLFDRGLVTATQPNRR
ncbi:rhomboid family intramembrane serine protease [Microbaculum marinum]|uniref:Rhomboid family intramembrane serine protease n=1 Tax=Microbaculum marinum TaxID=1764581 RepID=A0AAW9REB0_9HYPH